MCVREIDPSMTEAGLKEDNTTNRAEWRKKLISYTGESAILDDGTSQDLSS